MDASVPIQAQDLTRYYGRTRGVEGLDLVVDPGEIFGFLGPNGAGKTTTIRLLLDLIRPTRGTASLFGHPSRDPSVRARVGYLPGELALDGRMTGIETLRLLERLSPLGSDPGVHSRRMELCNRLGLDDSDLSRRVREYSRGMKQKIGLVSAFQHAPDLLILDEPTTGLDPLVREVVFQLLWEVGERGATVFHSSHVLSEVERTCTRVAILREGHMVADMRVEEVRRSTLRRMVVEFHDDPPLQELHLPGVETREVLGRQVILRVSGEPNELLKVLARHPVRHLSFPEPGLEEAFAAFYSGEERNDDA